MKVKVLFESKSINKGILPLHFGGEGGGMDSVKMTILQCYFLISQQHMKHFQQAFRRESLKIRVN